MLGRMCFYFWLLEGRERRKKAQFLLKNRTNKRPRKLLKGNNKK
jgi:hypothetical protein